MALRITALREGIAHIHRPLEKANSFASFLPVASKLGKLLQTRALSGDYRYGSSSGPALYVFGGEGSEQYGRSVTFQSGRCPRPVETSLFFPKDGKDAALVQVRRRGFDDQGREVIRAEEMAQLALPRTADAFEAFLRRPPRTWAALIQETCCTLMQNFDTQFGTGTTSAYKPLLMAAGNYILWEDTDGSMVSLELLRSGFGFRDDERVRIHRAA
ncbi:MAG: hypothetical protein WCP97_05685, partial [bacterium]